MRRKVRPILYTCSAVKDQNLISTIIEAENVEQSYSLFEKEHGIKPQIVLGPFYKKKSYNLDKNSEIRFKFGESKKGTYDGWHVTAMPLVSPENSLYLLFDRRIDGQRMHKPQATIIKIEDFYENEKVIFKQN